MHHMEANYTRMLCTVLNKFWKQYSHKSAVVWPLTYHLKSHSSKTKDMQGNAGESSTYTHKQYSLIDSCTWMCRCWPTNKDLLCANRGRWRQGGRVREFCADSATWWWYEKRISKLWMQTNLKTYQMKIWIFSIRTRGFFLSIIIHF